MSKRFDLTTITIMAVLAFVVMIVIVSVLAPPQPTAFTGDVVTIVDNCTRSNVTTIASVVGSSAISSKFVNADGILRCFYASGVTVNLNGDLVLMSEDT